ncbi:hypothetical protein KI688_002937 [Linnemannia hyalina]|uniref:Crinkler effector protein N-terminal domain-containing protein n=1 Tax=Linnemannia hyalina TaxID=64524 RepID=A0A9P7XRK0_9FUNG|nr:hypothetical protein KI688_002937 [Linnemannia hyalina]
MADNFQNLILFCLVDGLPSSRAFEIEVSETRTVAHLKDLIRAKQSPTFNDITGDQLTLWRVSIPVLPANKHRPIFLNEFLESATELSPATRLSKVFPEELPEETVHIIVQRPAPDVRADLSKIVDSLFDPTSQHTAFLSEFVQGIHNLPVTSGRISGLPCVGKRGLDRPRTAPSLMFFDLPSPVQRDMTHNQAEKILAEFPGIRHLPLFGVSGCGKTRTTVDLLSRSWGLYFNAGAADYGSSDMHTLVQALSVHSDVYVSKDIKQNTERIRCLTYGLLYARLVILERCLNIVGTRDTFSCQRWMLLQVATPAFEDIFHELFQSISTYIHICLPRSTTMNSTMAIIVQEQFRKVQELLRGRSPSSTVHSKFLVILDESQFLGRVFSEAFFDSDMATVRPVLAPVLFAFRRLAEGTSQDSICVMPCGTGLSSYDLTWSGGSASGAKLSADEYEASRLSEMVVDFAGWTDVGSISAYLKRLRQVLDDGGKERLDEIIPEEAVKTLFLHLRGRFRPIISTIEDIIQADDPMVWEECIHEREDRLTTACIPTTDGEKRRLEGNLCSELRRMFEHVRQNKGNVAYAEFRNVEATLKLAVATFITQGGYMAFKGQLPKLVETAFGRISLINGDFYTTIDEPFALLAADNYFRTDDPDYFQYRIDQLNHCSTERIRSKEWEASIPYEMVRIFHGKIVSPLLFHGTEPPHDMFRHKASVVGWTGVMRTIGSQEISMADFLDAHVNNRSERAGQSVPPFFYPVEHVSGPDILFVVRFSGLAPDHALGSSSTPTPGYASTDIVCPVFVQVKLCQKLYRNDVIAAQSTVQPTKIRKHGVKLSQFCKPKGHYISLIVSYPAEIAEYFLKRSLNKHYDGLTEIALTIDDSNFNLFSADHVQAIKNMKRLAVEMADTVKEVKRRRGDNISSKH